MDFSVNCKTKPHSQFTYLRSTAPSAYTLYVPKSCVCHVHHERLISEYCEGRAVTWDQHNINVRK